MPSYDFYDFRAQFRAIRIIRQITVRTLVRTVIFMIYSVKGHNFGFSEAKFFEKT